MECLDQMEQHQVYCDLFFTLGVPFEKKEDVYRTIRFQKELRNDIPCEGDPHLYDRDGAGLSLAS